VPAGTADRVRTTLQREGRGLRFHMASNPEFLREGMAIHDALEPDRIVVGVESARGLEVLRRLYAPLLEAGAPLIVTDIRTAELAKHASNAFLALKISFANALARVCERADADVTTVADIMGADPRIGRARARQRHRLGGIPWNGPRHPPGGHDVSIDRRWKEPAGPGGSGRLGLLVLPDGPSTGHPGSGTPGRRRTRPRVCRAATDA